MDSFLESVRAAAALDGSMPEELASLHAALVEASSVEEVKEILYALVDAFSADTHTTAHAVGYTDRYREGVLNGIAQVLRFLDRKDDAQWPLLPDDLLMLAMFFNELSTLRGVDVFAALARALSVYHALAVPAVHLAGTNTVKSADGEEEAVATRASVAEELAALQQILAKRVLASLSPTAAGEGSAGPNGSGRITVARAALDCLVSLLRVQLTTLAATTGLSLQDRASEAVDAVLSPLQTAVESLARPAAAVSRGARAPEQVVPASLLASVLLHVEEVLWLSQVPAETAGSKKDADALSAAALTAVFRHALNGLLAVLHRYLSLQQHRQTESAAASSSALGGDGGGSRGSLRDELAADALRGYGVQHGVQRALSVAAAGGASAAAAKVADESGVAVGPLTATLATGLQAALAAFGGAVHVRRPELLTRRRQQPAVSCEDAAELAREDDTWRMSHENCRARVCEAVLTHTGAANDGADDESVDGDDGVYLEDDDALMLGVGKEPLLQSSAGQVTAAALVEMVMLSVGALDLSVVDESHLRAVHLRGLGEMQLHAAKRAQAEELQRQRLIEQQGVEAIPATKLLEHVRDSAMMHTKGMTTLRRVPARAMLQKAAFSSVLRSYAYVRNETEATVRAAQALVGRCLVQMPLSLSDAALDELLSRLQAEFHREKKLRELNKSTFSFVAQSHSYYQLTVQVLFMSASAQAPLHERSGIDSMLFADGLGGMAGRGAGVNGASPAAGLNMTTRVGAVIDTENPIAFLQDENPRTASYYTASGGVTNGETSTTRKRARRDGRRAAADDGYGSDDDASDDDGAADEAEADFCFLNDTARAPSAYSHMLCRVVELIESCGLYTVLLDVFLQAPMLPRYVWGYLYRRFCLSTTSRERCIIGFRLLSEIATKRPVYRSCAVNLLLHLCLSSNEYARRVAIRYVGHLLSAVGSNGQAVVSPDMEAALVRHAKKQLAAIPGYQFTSVVRAAREAGSAAAAAAQSLDAEALAALQATEDKRAQELLGRHLGLFLKLCARQPQTLFPALLDVYKQCVERNNEVMVRLLPLNKDVCDMTRTLLEADPAAFVTTVTPFLRRYSADASLFVQTLLRIMIDLLRSLCTSGSATNGPDAVAERPNGPKHSPEYYREVAGVLLSHAKAMYERSRVPLGGEDDRTAVGGDGDDGFVLHDARFLTPLFSLLPSAELKQQYLPSFLRFVQVQLQFQRHYRQQQEQQEQQDAHHGSSFHHSSRLHSNGNLAILLLSAKERSFVLTHEELRDFIAQVTREVLVKAPFKFADGVGRGLSPVDFFTYLHRIPYESTKDAHAAGGPSSAAAPAIGVVTTKEVLGVCLDLTRAFGFDTTTGTPKLYGPEEVQRAVKKMMSPPPIPSQLMATVLLAISTMYPRGSRYSTVQEFLHFVVINVLTPLERASAWETDPQLWKGVVLFAEKFYRECSGFMVNLPDQVLIQALREHPRLAEHFREEHGNNASFGHILSNV